MSNTRYANFRSFLTERVIVAAVEVFEEVGNIERYYEENKCLRSLIPVTPDPVRKLTRVMPLKSDLTAADWSFNSRLADACEESENH